MRFYEASDFGLRVITGKYVNRENSNQSIRLISMCHIGDEKYYDNVKSYIENCEVVLFEGRKNKTGRLNLKNRERLANRLNLIVQPRYHLQKIETNFIHADYDEKTGNTEWNKLALIDRIKFNYVLPIWIYFQDRNITRKKFVKYFMRSNEDLEKMYGPLFDEKERIKDFMYKSREVMVFKRIDEVLSNSKDIDIKLGILYGAGHMKAISNFIESKHNFKLLKADFIEVFKI